TAERTSSRFSNPDKSSASKLANPAYFVARLRVSLISPSIPCCWSSVNFAGGAAALIFTVERFNSAIHHREAHSVLCPCRQAGGTFIGATQRVVDGISLLITKPLCKANNKQKV
ncbi:hypothetical protein M8371_31690, partial [Klebsiella pneumoniae]|nr:hypothetical protein [Klebsiella pneumoniae]